MLVAICDGKRLEAEHAERQLACVCPACSEPVFLKAGRIVIPHFSHYADTACKFGVGETIDHIRAKLSIHSEFKRRGLRSEMEWRIGGRVIDVAIWAPHGELFAIELQQSSISLDDLEARTHHYARARIAQMWIPFLRWDEMRNGWQIINSCMHPRDIFEYYAIRPYERWIHGFCYGKMWIYEPGNQEFYRAHYDWPDLRIAGPHQISELRLFSSKRAGKSLSIYNWPRCRLASFTTSDPEEWRFI